MAQTIENIQKGNTVYPSVTLTPNSFQTPLGLNMKDGRM